MEQKGQEMDKLQQELKDKEVENRIAGKKGDQLVRVCLFVSCCFLFNLSLFCCCCCGCCCCCCCCRCLWASFYFVFLLLVLPFVLFIIKFVCFVLFCFSLLLESNISCHFLSLILQFKTETCRKR